MVIQDVPSATRVRAPWRLWDEARLRRNVGVYLHVPFCLHRCRYCDFISFGQEHAERPALKDYLALLRREISARGAWAAEHYGAQGRRVDSVFFGGGTPSFLPHGELAGLVELAREAFQVEQAAEISIEANPESLTAELLRLLAQAGVNRLSVGVQAVQDRHLSFLGRTHRWRQTIAALEAAAAGPIRRVSFDVIYAIPRLTLAELRDSVRTLLALGPEHFSAYELTLEPGTWLHRWGGHYPEHLPPPEAVVRQQRVLELLLNGAGLYRYEVSNYALPGAECRHNLRYWRGGDYIGLGLSAASRIGTDVVNNPAAMPEYTRLAGVAGNAAHDPLCLAAEVEAARNTGSAVGAGAAASDVIAPPADGFLRLRTRLGLPQAELGAAAREQLPRWLALGWVRLGSGGRVEPTTRGLNFADAMAREL